VSTGRRLREEPDETPGLPADSASLGLSHLQRAIACDSLNEDFEVEQTQRRQRQKEVWISLYGMRFFVNHMCAQVASLSNTTSLLLVRSALGA
jgi:hypothetical protein